MKRPSTMAAIFAAILISGAAHAQSPTPTPAGFPPLLPVPGTGSLPTPANPTTFSFIAAGDNRPADATSSQPAILNWVFSDGAKASPAFFLWCGDIIYGRTTDSAAIGKQYAEFFCIAKLAGVPVFNAPGNHEMDVTQDNVQTPNSALQALYLQNMQFPPGAPAYGAFDYGNSRFIAMDTEEVASGTPTPTPTPSPSAASDDSKKKKKEKKIDLGYVSQQQFDLLAQDLEANTGKAHIFVFMHHPLIPVKASSGLNPPNPPNATTLMALFQKYPNVSYVLAAHEHLYYPATAGQTQGPAYVITGGAGAPLDSCDSVTGCGSYYHYLLFQVADSTVKVQVVKAPSPVPSATPCPSPTPSASATPSESKPR